MDKQRFLQSFELLIALIVTFQSNLKKHLPFLEKIAVNLDDYHGCSDFTELLKYFSVKEWDKVQKDILFVDFQDLPIRLSNLNILTLRERVILYTCIITWFKRADYQIFDKVFLQKVFILDDDLILAIDNFFSQVSKDGQFGKNEQFLLEPEDNSKESLEGQWIKSNEPNALRSSRSFPIGGIKNTLRVLYIDPLKIFLITCRDCTSVIEKYEQPNVCGWEILQPGESILLEKKTELNYHDLKNLFLSERYSQKLQLKISGLNYHYSSGKGIKKFSMDIEPGTLLGILGKEGSGKSTLLELLAGEKPVRSNEIIINGYDLSKDLYQMKGMIGFVPEEDLLYNELTVFENLYLTAKLYLGKTSSKEIHQKVESLLEELDLNELKNTIVGSFQDKFLQPGQRRLLNIALELLRDPQILIVDNAITPLSLADSSKIIEVLANYTFKGKIVLTTITQANKNSFSEFDKILILDDGGFPVYSGNASGVFSYFSQLFEQQPGAHDTLTPDAILQFINRKKFIEGTANQFRYKTPAELYEVYQKSENNSTKQNEVRKILPEKILHPPTLQRQYIIFFLRNFKSKISRRRELLYAVLITPFLALIISLFLRQSIGIEYSYSTNSHIPSYYFLSIIIAIFLGLIQSANEIIKERSINKKQEYLNLSRFSYINSKITYLFIISLIQSFLFVGIGNSILMIKGSLWVDWLIFFSCQSFGILLGLVFSNTQRSIESIYTKSIPIALILQIILGGGMINLNSLNLKNSSYTPLVADFIVSRWAYEASLVYRFRYNEFDQEFYDFDKNISNGKLTSLNLLPIIESQIHYCESHYQDNSDSVSVMLQSIKKTLNYLAENQEIFPYENIEMLKSEDFNSVLAADLLEYLEYLELHFYSQHVNSVDLKADHERQITDSLGLEYLPALKAKFHNYTIAEEVTNAKMQDAIQFYDGRPIQVKDAIYKFPESDIGRGQMYIPEKKFRGELIDTVEFNVSVIWLINFMLYVMLVTNILGKLGILNQKE